jgi:hypothetical protein
MDIVDGLNNTAEELSTVLQTIESTITNTSLTDARDFYLTVLYRLDSFGYEFDEDCDGWLIAYCIQIVESKIKNQCFTSDIPDGLKSAAVEMVCGEFLFSKKQSGKLELEDLDFDGILSSIKEGDTQVNFDAGATDEKKIEALISHMIDCGKGDYACFRRIRW